MKTLSKVVWSEGMYVGPQHFQAQNRYFEDFVQFSTDNLWFQPFGLLGFELNQAALADGTVALVHARGLFPDGLPFHMPEYDQLPPPRNIAGAFPLTAETIDVKLAIPVYRPDGTNCLLPGSDASTDARYLAEEISLADENTGEEPKAVKLGRKNVRFLAGAEPETGLVTLPLARVRRDVTAGFVYDPDYIPACLRISASEALMLLLRRLVDILEEKARTIARPKNPGATSGSGFSAEGIANAWFLNAINSALGPLRHECISKRAHPEHVFAELSRLAGALCTFSLDSHPNTLPLYDWRNLGVSFRGLDRHIREHLELVVPSNCVAIPLTAVAPYFYAGEIKDERTLNRSRWIFAIRCGAGEAQVIESVPRLVKICSREFMPRLIDRALPGLKLTHLAVPPPAVSPRVEFQYFMVDKAGGCWEHMVLTRQLVAYVPGELPDPEIELSVVLES